MKVPYVDLSLRDSSVKNDLLRRCEDIMNRGDFILGEEVETFEREFADRIGTEHAVAANSGTDALVLALRSLDVGEKDEVITVPNSFVASTSCIALAGATPVFVDVREDYNMDPDQIEDAISEHTRAILPVHLTGRPANMDAIMKVAKDHDLHVIEDSSQAILATWKEQPVGSIGKVGCFSLHPLKTLNACGDAGVLVTDDAEVADTCRQLRNHGLEDRNTCREWGYNTRMDTMQAGILLAKTEYLEEWTNKRRENASLYRKNLSDISEVKAPGEPNHGRSVYHTFVIRAKNRDDLQNYLEENGVDTAVHYPRPIHLQPAAKDLGYKKGDFPVTERQADRILSLPIYPELTDEQIHYVCDTIREFYS